MPITPHAHRACELANVGASLLEHGVRPGHLLKQVGLPARVILEPTAWVARPLFLKLVNALPHLTGEPHMVLQIAERDPLEKLGMYGHAILNAHSLRHALTIAKERLALVQTGVRIDFVEQDSEARLRYEILGRPGENPEKYIEGVLAFLLKIPGLTGAKIPVRVCFTCERPRKTGELERVFGPDLSFRAPYNGFTFDRSYLDLPLQRTMSENLFKQNGRLTTTPEEELVRAVRTTIDELMVRQSVPTLDLIARMFGLHKRTLQRRLDKWGTNFEVLLDQIRRERALESVLEGHRTMTDIAFFLGYSDPSHFIRAFRRWTGMTPRDYLSTGLRHQTTMFLLEWLPKSSSPENHLSH